MSELQSYKEAHSYICQQLTSLYELSEAVAIADLALQSILSVSKLEVLMGRASDLSVDQQNSVRSIALRLKNGEPIQYILGETEFFGHLFKVGAGVLIPRPETEELVDWICTSHRQFSGKLLDIGCGSGCIAVSLASAFSNANVTAVDVSDFALRYTAQNADLNNVTINILQEDILNPSPVLSNERFDIIVSNPPYVLASEKQLMHKNVLDNEPHLALFVDDTDSLLFYNVISDLAKSHLNLGGWLYFEINEQKGNETVEMLNNKGFVNIELRKDLNGKDRMVAAELLSVL